MRNAVMEVAKSPRDVKTSRARVWQEEWEWTPWDYCRRTACTETGPPTHSWHEERERNKREVRMSRYRQYQIHFYGSPVEKERKKYAISLFTSSFYDCFWNAKDFAFIFLVLS